MRPTRATVDACIWISAYVQTELDHIRCRELIDQIQRGRHHIYIPEVLVTETVCRLASKFRKVGRDPMDALRLGQRMASIKMVRLIASDWGFLTKATEIGVKHNLRGFDAIVALTAIENQCDLITNDNDFFKSSVSQLVTVRRP